MEGKNRTREFRRRLFILLLVSTSFFSLAPNVMFTLQECFGEDSGLAYLFVALSHVLLTLGFAVLGVLLVRTLRRAFPSFFLKIR